MANWFTAHDDMDALNDESIDYSTGIVGLANAAIIDGQSKGIDPRDALDKFADEIPSGVYAATGILLESMRNGAN